MQLHALKLRAREIRQILDFNNYYSLAFEQKVLYPVFTFRQRNRKLRFWWLLSRECRSLVYVYRSKGRSLVRKNPHQPYSFFGAQKADLAYRFVDMVFHTQATYVIGSSTSLLRHRNAPAEPYEKLRYSRF
ncbi:unnamed protein product [Amoebophrya sp. A120]|nr:unnamed protein product [Amoebophrya sp. A120]|eukprot:GSA120T00005244001.1